MNIHQNCLLDLLEKKGFHSTYIDVHKIGSVTYFFDNIILKFTDSCLPIEITMAYLEIFSLQEFIHEIQTSDCSCNW
jgi:hypothetical protein